MAPLQEWNCKGHKHVEWVVDYQMLPTYSPVYSSTFVIGPQKYSLNLHGNLTALELNLCRMGPATRNILHCLAGVKRGDGSYDHRLSRVQCYQSETFERLKWGVRLATFHRYLIENRYLDCNGHLMFFVQLETHDMLEGNDTCNHGLDKMTPSSGGSIREEDCSCEKYVEWEVKYALLPNHSIMSSPTFSIGSQLYLLELCPKESSIDLSLFRAGPSTDYRLQYISGAKRSDGSYYYMIETYDADQREQCELWMSVKLLSSFHRTNLQKRHLSEDGRLIFFVRMKKEQIGEENCTHGIVEMKLLGEGLIREEECSGHKYVEWDVEYTSLPEDNDTFFSPVFTAGAQRYLLDLVCKDNAFRLRLFRFGPSENQRVRYFTGLKRGDGSYHHVIKRSDFELSFECVKWWNVKEIDIFARYGRERWLLNAEGKVTIFVRIETEQAHAGADICTHGTDRMTPLGAGLIRQEDCSDHKHVEWDVEYTSLPQMYGTLSSPAFSIGNQWYLLDLHPYDVSLGLRLYRFGPSSESPGRCRGGIKSRDGFYHRNITSEVFNHEKACDVWTFALWLGNFDKYDLRNRHLAPNGRITFFFQMNVEHEQTEAKACIHGAVRPIASGEGRILDEQCSDHKHVEWEVEYDMLPEDNYTLKSPCFAIGSQRYYVQLKGRAYFHESELNMTIFRAGPPTERSVLCFVGVKRGDGSYYQDIMFMKIRQEEECVVWTPEFLQKFNRDDLKNQYLAPDGPVTVFVRISEKRTQAGAEMCSFGLANLPSSGEGCIRIEECSGHKHVEWNVKYAPKDDIQSSPTFQIGAQLYVLDMSNNSFGGQIRLFRSGPAEKVAVRCFFGMKHRDGTYNHETLSMDVFPSHDSELWTLLRTHSHLSRFKIGPITIFLQFIEEKAKPKADMCSYCAADMNPSGDGRIRLEECDGHIHMEWDLKKDIFNGGFQRSPTFQIGEQRYLLDFVMDYRGGEVRLYRKGPSSDLPLVCFLGMRRRDETYNHEIFRMETDQSCARELWTLEWSCTHPVFCRERRLTVFLRIIEEQSESIEDMCSYCAAKRSPSGHGCIREVECSGHKHVEWDVEFDIFQINGMEYRSPAFEIGSQQFRLDFRSKGDGRIPVRLFRMGPSAKSPLRCVVGMKFGDGFNDHRTKSELIDMEKDYEMWTLLDTCVWFERRDLLSRRLPSNRIWTLLIRMDDGGTHGGAETCSYSAADLSPRSSGSVTEVEWDFMKRVDWNVEYESSVISTSPLFSLSGQNYLLEMNYDTELYLRLYRMGPSVTESVRLWSNVRRGDGSSQQWRSQCGHFDLEDESCSTWKCVSVMHEHVELSGEVPVTASILMSLEQRNMAKVSTRARRRSQKDSKIVFRVKNKEYEINRVVLCFRVPVLKPMFSHDCVEGRTGVVCVEDYEPDVFQAFLDYIYKGEPEVVTVENCFVLYSIAHKYFLEELKDECLRMIKETTISHANFFDAVNFLLACSDNDVQREVTCFLSKNKDIIKTKVWRKLYKDSTNAANDLLVKAFLPEK